MQLNPRLTGPVRCGFDNHLVTAVSFVDKPQRSALQLHKRLLFELACILNASSARAQRHGLAEEDTSKTRIQRKLAQTPNYKDLATLAVKRTQVAPFSILDAER